MYLTEFLSARLDEDEAVARDHDADWVAPYDEGLRWYTTTTGRADMLVAHPARVLAEVAAKRAVLDGYMSAVDWASDPDCSDPGAYRRLAAGMGDALRMLAQPYADHTDFDPAWRL